VSHLDEWQPFSVRYGRSKPEDATWADKRPWGTRHALLGGLWADEKVRCDCPGSPHGGSPCRQACTQEDLLCDECRQWCYAVDAAGNYHQFATLRSR